MAEVLVLYPFLCGYTLLGFTIIVCVGSFFGSLPRRNITQHRE